MITLVTGWQNYTIDFRFLFFMDNNDALDLSFGISTNDVIVRSKYLFNLLLQAATGHDFFFILDSLQASDPNIHPALQRLDLLKQIVGIFRILRMGA